MTIPQITWAQSMEHIYLFIELEPKEDDIKFTNNSISFKQDEYEFILELADKISAENCIINKTRIFEITLFKENTKYWDHILKDRNLYKNNITINWNKWIDEDATSSDEFNINSLITEGT